MRNLGLIQRLVRFWGKVGLKKGMKLKTLTQNTQAISPLWFMKKGGNQGSKRIGNKVVPFAHAIRKKIGLQNFQ